MQRLIPIEYYELDSINSNLIDVIEKHLDSAKYHGYEVDTNYDVIYLPISYNQIFDSISGRYKDDTSNLMIASCITKTNNNNIYKIANAYDLYNYYRYKYKNIDIYILVDKYLPVVIGYGKNRLQKENYIIFYREYNLTPDGTLPFSLFGYPVDYAWYYENMLYTMIPLNDLQ
ncbi:MAG: hypothetical protein IJV31_06805 [Clostridia bacterium]|nr:hypothetical protein [Clostridia bacterium]